MTPGTCSRCSAAVMLARAPAAGWRRPILQFGVSLQDAWAVDVELDRARGYPGIPGPMLGLSEAGALLAVVRAVDGGVELPAPAPAAPRVRVRFLHAFGCPAERNLPARPWGDAATCSGCQRPIVWIVTPTGKKAPLDPEPHTGVVLEGAAAREARGTAGYVIGLDVNGEQRSVREGGQMLLGEQTAEQATVWVNHFATCPRRADFARPRRGSPSGE